MAYVIPVSRVLFFIRSLISLIFTSRDSSLCMGALTIGWEFSMRRNIRIYVEKPAYGRFHLPSGSLGPEGLA